MKHYIFTLILAVLFVIGLHPCFSQDVIKILAIGSSSSQDAVEEYLDDLARLAEYTGITIIIPVATTIQNARISLGRDNFCRDGYHLNDGLGRYAAACAWFETLLGKSVVGNNFFPETFIREEAHIIQLSA